MKQILFIFLLFYTTFAYSAQLCYVSREDAQKAAEEFGGNTTISPENLFITNEYASGVKTRFMALMATQTSADPGSFTNNIEHEFDSGPINACYCRMLQPFVSKWKKTSDDCSDYEDCKRMCNDDVYYYPHLYFDNLVDAKYQNLSSEYTIANPTCPDGNILIKKISVIEKDNCTTPIPLKKPIPANTTCTDASGTYTYTSECQVPYSVNLDANNCPAKPENPEN